MSIGTIILIILVIALLGGFSGVGGGPFYGTGYYGGRRLGILVVVLLIFLLPVRICRLQSRLTVQLLHRAFDRRCRIVVAVPRLALRKQGRDGANGVALWI